MTDYNESTVAGSKWTRCKAIHITNEYGRLPHIIFGEEELLDVGDTDPIHKSVGSEIHANFDPVNGNIPLLDPTTNQPLGTSITHIELYTILYSLYMQKAQERDNALVVI